MPWMVIVLFLALSSHIADLKDALWPLLMSFTGYWALWINANPPPFPVPRSTVLSLRLSWLSMVVFFPVFMVTIKPSLCYYYEVQGIVGE